MIENLRPKFFYRVFQVFAYLGAIPFVINTVDILLNPLATPPDGSISYRLVSGLIIAPITLIIAFLCIRRASDNLIGWMLVTFAYGASVQAMRVGLLPPTPAVLIANQFISFFWLAYMLIPIYFPTGQLYPPRLNRWGNALLSTLITPLFISPIFNRTIAWGTGENELSITNPFFIAEIDFSVFSIALGLGILIFGTLSLFLRYRGGSALERLQLRWLLAGVIVQFGLLFLSTGLAEVLHVDSRVVSAFYAVIIPIAIGIAILRYRLYDIDIIIRRTLIYAILTTILGVIYFGGVILTQQLFKSVTGQTSDLAIVISTLLIAALFSPLRRRVQDIIDSRLYRRKYDAEKTLAQFQQNLRNEVDMETLKANLVSVVSDTMQPDKIALWVKEK